MSPPLWTSYLPFRRCPPKRIRLSRPFGTSYPPFGRCPRNRIKPNARGNLLSTNDANNNTHTVKYDALGRPTTLTDGAGNQTTLSYLGGDLLQVINPAGNTMTRSVDSAGRLTQLANGTNDLTGYEYNALNQITRVIDAATEDTLLGYDHRDCALADLVSA